MSDSVGKGRLPQHPFVSPPSTTGKSSWADIIGPCYTAKSLARVLGWTESGVAEAAASLRLLELRISDNVILYPAFQLWNGGITHGLPEVLHVLRTGTASAWTWAQWLNTRRLVNHGVEESNNIERLRDGYLNDVLRDAEHDAAAWRA